MTELQFSNTADRPASTLDTPGTVDLGPWLGQWRNTRDDSACIAGFTLRSGSEGFLLGVEPHGADHWGEAPVMPCSAGVDSGAGVAFFASYDFGFIEHRLAANANKGLIIIAAYSLFRDGSGRHDYFTREFFYLQTPTEP